MHVDGFRFDLATVLGRAADGYRKQHGLLDRIGSFFRSLFSGGGGSRPKVVYRNPNRDRSSRSRSLFSSRPPWHCLRVDLWKC